MSTTYITSAQGFASGLVGTIGYTLVNADGTINTARTTSGISQTPNGNYVASATLPTGFTGVIEWDNGGSPVKSAVDSVSSLNVNVVSWSGTAVSGAPPAAVTVASAASASDGALWIDSDNVPQLSGLMDNLTGAYQNAATVTGVLSTDEAATQVVLAGITFTYVATSNGNYRATIPYGTALTLSQNYYLTVTAVVGSNQKKFRAIWQAKYDSQ